MHVFYWAVMADAGLTGHSRFLPAHPRISPTREEEFSSQTHPVTLAQVNEDQSKWRFWSNDYG